MNRRQFLQTSSVGAVATLAGTVLGAPLSTEPTETPPFKKGDFVRISRKCRKDAITIHLEDTSSGRGNLVKLGCPTAYQVRRCWWFHAPGRTPGWCIRLKDINSRINYFYMPVLTQKDGEEGPPMEVGFRAMDFELVS